MLHPGWVSLASFVAVTAACLVGLSLESPRDRQLNRRLASLARGPAPSPISRQVMLEQPFFKRVILPALSGLAGLGARMTPAAQREWQAEHLRQAGIYSPYGAQAMLAFKVLVLSLAVVAAWLLRANPGLAMTASATLGLIGVIGPDRWVRQRIRTRRDAMVAALPDSLDLVTSCVEAGLSFDGAVLRMTSRSSAHGQELRDELGRYLTDVRMGRTRHEALRDLSMRCGVNDLEGVVAALIQADQLGVGVAQVLRAQSLHLRARRRQRAQESALKAPIKMLFPLVFFIFPAMFIVTLGPAILRILDTFAHVH